MFFSWLSSSIILSIVFGQLFASIFVFETSVFLFTIFVFFLTFLFFTRNFFFSIDLYLKRTQALLAGCIIIFWTCLFVVIGPFDVVPSDIISHFHSIKRALIRLEVWGVQRFEGNWFSDKANLYGYTVFALVLDLLNLDNFSRIRFLSWFSPLLLLLVFMEWSTFIFSKAISSPLLNALASAGAVIMFPLMLGVDSFSYIRAYFAAAACLGMILYFCICYLFLRLYLGDFGRSERNTVFVFVLLIFFAQVLIHPQEALFSFSTGIGYITLIAIRSYCGNGSVSHCVIRLGLVVFLGVLVSGVSASIFYPAVDPGQFVYHADLILFDFYIIDFIEQGLRTLGWAGFAILALGLLVRVPTLSIHFGAVLVGFLVTAGNPLFVHLLIDSGLSSVLYRFFFILMPSLWFGGLMAKFGQVAPVSRENVCKAAAGFGLLLCFCVWGLSSKRVQSMSPLLEGERVVWWEDLFVYMEGLDPFKIIYTDPVTGYLVNGLSNQEFFGSKFVGGSHFVPMVLDNFVLEKYEEKRGTYLVVNLRNGVPGDFSKEVGHWPEEVLDLRKYYSSDLLKYIESSPLEFLLQWRSVDGRISVYLIR